MIGGGFDSRAWVGVAIGLALVLAIVRLLLWQRSAPVEARSPRPRMGLLLGLQLVAGLLLYLTLFPPSDTVRTGALIVATHGATAPISRASGDILVALPEAGALAGAVRVPDLATALRRFPSVARIRVLGQGLVPRDQIALRKPLEFDPPPPPRGLIDLTLPEAVAPGATISVGGRIGALTSGIIELVDPAGVVVDRARITSGARFVVTTDTRTPGLALFGLRLRDAAGGVVEQIAIPVQTLAQTQPRVRVLAGAPGPETKYLRRWAEDAAIDFAIDIDVGGGVQLGDGPIPLTRSTLGEIDLVVIDDRRWQTLSAGDRAALASAVADGLGLLLRPTSPLTPATRRDWAALGLRLSGGDDGLPLRLDPESPPAGSELQPPRPAISDALPELVRRDLADEGSGAVSLVRDADGVALASWRSRGRGRVGLWTITDSYALALTGRADRYAALWSELFSAVARAGDDNAVRIVGLARTGARITVCGVNTPALVLAPTGGPSALMVDPRTSDQRCAAYWPISVGWHLVRDGQARETPFYAHHAEDAPSLVTWANRQGTLALVTTERPTDARFTASSAPGSPWPWFGGLLAILALLWWFERKRDWPPRHALSGGAL